MNFYERKSLINRKYKVDNKRPVLKSFNFTLNEEQIASLIYLLEIADNEFLRMFKRVPKEDLFMRDIYYYYRQHGKQLRAYLRKVRGF
jgi:hypothetical protein